MDLCKMIALAVVAIVGCSARAASPATDPAKHDKTTSVKNLPPDVEQLLNKRLNGGMGNTFAQFANMFLVSSRLQLNRAIALATSSRETAEAPLQSPFPRFYKPTLREFLDAIALQTFSQWKYDSSDRHIQSDKQIPPTDRPVIFEFTPTKRHKPFAVTLPKGWKCEDQGNWLMLIPPSAPVGLDIYEMGTYSCDDKASEKELFTRVRQEVAREWAQRVNAKADLKDMSTRRVAAFEALSFEAMVPSKLNKDVRWRQWVFMVTNRCFFVVSTISPEAEATIYPDVEKILATFRIEPGSGD
jgi:hypothetical protein